MEPGPREGNTLYNEGITYISIIQQCSEMGSKRAEALEALKKSPDIRNALMSLPPPKEGEDAASIDVVLDFHLELASIPDSSLPANKKQKTGGKNEARNKKRAARKSVAHAIFRDAAIFRHCKKRFPLIVLYDLLTKTPFIEGLVGNELLDSLVGISMYTIFSRLAIIEVNVTKGNDDCRKPKELGRSWIPRDRHTVLMDCEKSWQLHFETVLSRAGYLDDLAGISFPGQTRKKGSGDSLPHGQHAGRSYSIDSKEDSCFGGFLEWSQNCFSPRFLGYFHNDVLPTMYFMQYPRSQARHIRCESPSASHTNPVYFQLGVQPNACLVRASESSKFGDCLLKICNFVEEERFQHFFHILSMKFGRHTAKEFTPPRKSYDLLFAMVGDDSFKSHSDSKEMLFDESIQGWEEIYLRVLTVFFQNTNDEVVKMQLKPKLSSSHLKEMRVPLGPNGMHEQGYGNQTNMLHGATMSRKPRNFRRMVWTARATLPLQHSGLTRLRKQQGRLPVYGGPQEYKVNGYTLFFPSMDTPATIPTDRQAPGLPLKPPSCETLDLHTDDEEATSDDMSDTLPLQEDFSFPSAVKDIIYFGRRVGEFDYYPSRIGSVLVCERQSVWELLTSAEGHEQLSSHRVRLHIEDDLRCIPFGPCPESMEEPQSAGPAKIGTMFPWVQSRKYYGVPTSVENSAPWNTPSHRLSSIYLFKRYKTPLESLSQRNSAAYEAHRILTPNMSERKGFYVYFSGGNGYGSGSVPPDAEREQLFVEDQPGVALYSSRGMTLKNNPRNMSLFEASTQSRIVTVFIAGQNLPKNLRFDEGNNQMCLHAGQYLIHPMEVCQAQSSESIRRSIEACEEVNLPLLDPVEIQHLGFLTRLHFRCWLAPVDIPLSPRTRSGKWSTLTLPTNSKERFAYPVPRETRGSDLVLQSNMHVPTSKELIQAYLASHSCIGTNSSCATDRVIVDQLKRKQLLSPTKFFDTIRRLVLAYSMRVLQVNVDDDNRISCLADIPQPGEVKAKRYKDLLGDGHIRYCGALGQNAQEHPYPCPFPSGDAKLIYLQEANRGRHSTFAEARQARRGLNFLRSSEEAAARLLVQCFIAETTGNPNCNQMWRDAFVGEQGGQPLLPGTPEECRHYLSFIHSAMRQGHGSFTQFLHGHYKLHQKLRSFDTFSVILMKFAENAQLFIRETVKLSDDYHREGKDPSLLRSAMLQRFQCWLLSTTEASCWDPFHLSKIFAAMEDLICDHPFGPVCSVPLGFGSQNGRRLIDWELFSGVQQDAGSRVNISIEECTKMVLEYLLSRLEEHGDDWFGYLYRDTETGLLCQRINGREINAIDVDHFLCKIFIYEENEPQGSRAVAISCRPQLAHCFPMKSFSSAASETLARHAIRKYKLEHGQLGMYFFPYSEERAEQATLSAAMLRRWSVEAGRRGGIIYTNPHAIESGVATVPHEYNRRTFVRWAAWPTDSTVEGKVQVLENGYGLGRAQTTDFAELPCVPSRRTNSLPMVAAARCCEEVAMCEGSTSLCDTFTMHSQVEGNSSGVTTFDYHIDKQTQGSGPVLILPIEGMCYFFVSSKSDHLERLDDSRQDFSHWKSSLPPKEKGQVDSFVEGLRKYASRYNHQYLNVYKLEPGTAMLFPSSLMVHGTIIPAQEGGKTRKILLFHSLRIS